MGLLSASGSLSGLPRHSVPPYPSTAVSGFILLECSSHSLPQLTGGREMNDFSCMGECHATPFFCSLDPWSQAGKADGMMCILLVRGFLFFFFMNKIMTNIFIFICFNIFFIRFYKALLSIKFLSIKYYFIFYTIFTKLIEDFLFYFLSALLIEKWPLL